ncbi:MAG: hypothetical protein J6Y94_03450 [Bacteriovoracaceae bacterium]|nr:hypothetical protein [Bacteriovoracaceae bacterium]
MKTFKHNLNFPLIMRPCCIWGRMLLLLSLGFIQNVGAAWSVADLDLNRFNGGALRQLQGEVGVELEAHPGQMAATYNDFLAIVGRYLDKFKVAYKMERSFAYSPYKTLTITPLSQANAAPLNVFAQQLKENGYTLQFFSPTQIKYHKDMQILATLHTVYVGAKNLGHLTDFLTSKPAQEILEIVRQLKRSEFNFLQYSTTQLTETKQELPSNPRFSFMALTLDAPQEVIVLHPYQSPREPFNFLKIFRSFYRLHNVAQQVVQDFPTWPDEFPVGRHNFQFPYTNLYWLTLQYANNLGAAIYVMAQHPERVQVKRGLLEELQIKVQFSPQYPDELYQLNLFWPKEKAVPAHPQEVLSSPYLQALYRYLFTMVEELAAHRPLFQQEGGPTREQFAKAIAAWPALVTAPITVWDTVNQKPATREQFVQEVLAQQPKLIKQFENHFPLEKFGAILEDRFRQNLARIKSLPRDVWRQKAQNYYRNFLNEVALYLENQGIDSKLHRAGQDIWLEIIASERSPFNRLAAQLNQQGFSLQYMGLNHLQNGKIGFRLAYFNYQAKRVYLGSKALRRPESFIPDPAITAIIKASSSSPSSSASATVAASSEDFSSAQNSAPIDTQVRHDLDQVILSSSFDTAAGDIKENYRYEEISVVEPRLPIVILHRQQSRLHYGDLYKRSWALLKSAQALATVDLAQLPHKGLGRLLKQFRKDYYNLIMTAAWHLLDWHVILHTLQQKDQATQVNVTLENGVLRLAMTPDKNLPQLKLQLEFAWPSDQPIPLKAAELLQHKNLQRPYRYHVRLWELLAQAQEAMDQLHDDQVASIQQVAQLWSSLAELPGLVAAEIPTDLKVTDRSWQADLIKHQPQAIQYLKTIYQNRAVRPNSVERCVRNFLNESAP